MIPRFVEFKVNVLAQEFIDWFAFQLECEGPTEYFYHIFLGKYTSVIFGQSFEYNNEWVWTPAKTLHDDKIWWRVYVDITDSGGEERRIEVDGALACCLTQISGNPTAPRLQVKVDWSHLFAGSAWEFIEALGETYHETADVISAWQASEAGRAARLAWVNSCKYPTSLSRSKIEALYRLPVQELVSRDLEDPASLWICEKLDRFAVEYAMARMLPPSAHLEESQAAYKDYKAATERVKAWEEYRENHPHESAPAPSAGRGEEESGAVDPAEEKPPLQGGRYGTNRDLTFEDVARIVKRCRAWQKRGGKVPDFYRSRDITPGGAGFYELSTLRSWLYSEKFK